MDLLYFRLDERRQPVVNERVSEDSVFDIGEHDTIIGSEIPGASRHVNLETLLPLRYEVSSLRPGHA